MVLQNAPKLGAGAESYSETSTPAVIESQIANIESQTPEIESQIANIESQTPEIESQTPEIESHSKDTIQAIEPSNNNPSIYDPSNIELPQSIDDNMNEKEVLAKDTLTDGTSSDSQHQPKNVHCPSTPVESYSGTRMIDAVTLRLQEFLKVPKGSQERRQAFVAYKQAELEKHLQEQGRA
jgi:hypothetical protein